MNFTESTSSACIGCVWLEQWACKSPAGACMHRVVSGIPTLRVGEIVEFLGMGLPDGWRDRNRQLAAVGVEADSWTRQLDERERRLVQNCCTYASSDPAGLPGHNLMIIVAKMAAILDDQWLVDASKRFPTD